MDVSEMAHMNERIELAVLKEREACAKVCETLWDLRMTSEQECTPGNVQQLSVLEEMKNE